VTVLTPTHPEWGTFADRLADLVFGDSGCDGDESRGPNPNCFRHAKEIMAELGGFDIAASIEFFKAHGGYCDCEILFNVDPD
jgi:hypothetical protein